MISNFNFFLSYPVCFWDSLAFFLDCHPDRNLPYLLLPLHLSISIF